MLKSDELKGPSCLTSAADDEPIFVLRANDELAARLVRMWAGAYYFAKGGFDCMTERQRGKYAEALELAHYMERWRHAQALPTPSEEPPIAEPITEDWLRSVGFKWHQFDRQPEKHWLLWLGNALPGRLTSFEDLGLELTSGAYEGPGQPTSWFCWLRDDAGGRYHRFIHLRHLKTTHDVAWIAEAISGQRWDPANHWGGSMYTPKGRAHISRALERADWQNKLGRSRWFEVEKDDTRGRALPEHMEAAEKARQERSDEGK